MSGAGSQVAWAGDPDPVSRPCLSCCALRSPSSCTTSSSAPLPGSWCRASTSTECRSSLGMWIVVPCASTTPWAGAALLCCWVRSYPLRPVSPNLCPSCGLTSGCVPQPDRDPSTSRPTSPTQGGPCVPLSHFLPMRGSQNLEYTSLVLPLPSPKALRLGWTRRAMGTLTSAGSPSMNLSSGVSLALSSLSLW